MYVWCMFDAYYLNRLPPAQENSKTRVYVDFKDRQLADSLMTDYIHEV